MGVKLQKSITIGFILLVIYFNYCKTAELNNNDLIRSNSSLIKFESSYGNYCEYPNECGPNQICVNHYCRCASNYFWNSFACDIINCKLDSDCWGFDSKRKCNL